MQSTQSGAERVRSLPAPLRVVPDMPSRWNDVELDFDTAAERIVRAHEKDGEHRDLPIADFKTWIVAPHEGNFALAPLAGHHPPKPMRSSACSRSR